MNEWVETNKFIMISTAFPWKAISIFCCFLFLLITTDGVALSEDHLGGKYQIAFQMLLFTVINLKRICDKYEQSEEEKMMIFVRENDERILGKKIFRNYVPLVGSNKNMEMNPKEIKRQAFCLHSI